ncbi:MAG: cobQ [Nitrososphaera sp.]|jgi:adenosylcobyric acid synthase|nr:cobQ [Nitrososphaera sp.]MDQ3561608.1 cobyric acid synthase [Thermoproteota archaeon]
MTRRAKLIMIQGTTSGAGKSTIAIGLCRLFSDRGYNVAPFKAQNMSSNFFTTSSGSKMALVQAIQAVAARKEPDPRMNPILLKPLGEYRSTVFLNGRFYSEMYAKEYYEKFVIPQGLTMVLKALESLRSENDIIVIEGAGSPSEINIAKYDIANMLLAQEVGAPVIIVADIERGGCFASIVGTAQLLKPTHRAMVKGFLINKFRGDITLIAPAIKEVQKMTKKRILGIIPKIEFNLPEEDSLVGSVAGKAEVPREAWNWQIDLIAKAIKENIDMERISKVVGL